MDSLREIGFTVIAGQSNPAIPSDRETNAIWYGSNVGVDQVKLVAVTLIRAGIALELVQPFKYENGKADRIEVVTSRVTRGGVDVPLRDRPCAVQEIVGASEFPVVIDNCP